MGLRERIEREVRAAIRHATTTGGGRINVVTRTNKVVVRNVGGSGGRAHAHAEQTAPIVQEPPGASDPEDEETRKESS
jgi:hypothetical protein